MPTQNVNLSDHLSEFIRECVESGRYQNASEVVRSALRLLQRDEEEYGAKLERLKAEIQIGLDDIEAGRYIELNSDEDFDRLSAEIRRSGREDLARRANDDPAASA